MKKSALTVCFALVAAGAFAQTTQGTMAVAGSVRFWNENSKYNNNIATDGKNITRQLILQPSVGYFVKDKLELGMGIGLYRHYQTNESENGSSYGRDLNVSLNPHIRKYVTLTDQLQLHGTGFAYLGFGNYKSKGLDDTSPKITQTSNSFGFGIYPGLTYFATPKIGVTATFGSLSFSRNKEKPKNSTQAERTTYRYDANLHPSSISVGFGYFIAR